MAIYIIQGSPTPLVNPRSVNAQVWDKLKQKKHEAKSQLEEQNQDNKVYTKPISVDVVFYFNQPNIYQLNSHPHGYNSTKPDIADLIRFVESVITNTLLNDTYLIASLTSKKLYDDSPRTEIIITELKNENKKD